MFQIIIGGSLLIVAISIFATYQSAAKPRKNILLGSLLPEEALQKEEVLRLVDQYKRGNILAFIVFLLAELPMFFIPKTSIIILYMGIWCAAYYIISSQFFHRAFAKVLLLKSKNRWFPNEYEFRSLKAEERKTKSKLLPVLRRWIPTTRELLLAQEQQPVYVDQDEYWIDGYYCNPEDVRATVEKRVGFGTTNNLGTRIGKLMAFIAPIFVTAVIGGVFILFLIMDFATFQMRIEGDTVKMKAPMYDYQFKAEDMEKVTLTQELPENGIRTNGAATESYYLGNFRLEGYGSSKVYIYIKYPPYIVVSLSNGKTVLFNSKEEKETKECYRELLELKNK